MSTPVSEGDVLAKRYRVDRVLGAGGMGVVVAATHIELGKKFALKFLLPEALRNPEAVARFSREARAAANLSSPHVAAVSDVGRLDTGAPYIVMEYLEGRDLAEAVKDDGPLNVVDAVDYVLQACEALAEAHAAGLVHRDLKPANLFLTKAVDGSPMIKVLDFGISKSSAPTPQGSDPSLTSTSAMMGSPLYMSPEQLQSAKDVDPRADVWALGAILFELLAGRPPFWAETLANLCIAIIQQAPASLQELRPNIPPELAPVVLRCLEKNPAHRYQHVADLAIALMPFASKGMRGSVKRISRVVESSGQFLMTALPSSDDDAVPLVRRDGPVVDPSQVLTDPGKSGTAPLTDSSIGDSSTVAAESLPQARVSDVQPAASDFGPTSSSWGRTSAGRGIPGERRRSGVFIVGAAAVVLLGGGAAVWGAFGGDPSPPAAGAPAPSASVVAAASEPEPEVSPVSTASETPSPAELLDAAPPKKASDRRARVASRRSREKPAPKPKPIVTPVIKEPPKAPQPEPKPAPVKAPAPKPPSRKRNVLADPD